MASKNASKSKVPDNEDAMYVLHTVQKGAAENLKLHGEIEALFFIILANNEMVPELPDFTSDAAKKKSFARARKKAKELDAWSFVLVSEAWIDKGTKTNLKGVSIYLFTADGKQAVHQPGTIKGRRIKWEALQFDPVLPSALGGREVKS